MFSHEFTPIKFSLWFHTNRTEIEQQYLSEVGSVLEQVRRCFDCDGRGYHNCDLGHSHDCDPCDGSGKVTKEIDEVLQDYARNIYDIQVSKDREKVFNFLKEQSHAS